MNYQLIYDRLMLRARSRARSRSESNLLLGYAERHRIVPGCIGGKYVESNIAYLTPEEHYLAHQLLAKIYPEEVRFISAAVSMAASKDGQRANNKVYGWLRRKFAIVQSEKMKGNTLRRGAKMSNDTIEKMRANSTGKKHSEETKKKISESNRKPRREGTGAAISAAKLGKKRYYNPSTLESICVAPGTEPIGFVPGMVKKPSSFK